MNLRYDYLAAHYECNIDEHAQKVMESLGIEYEGATPQSMGDQWWFWNCSNLPSPLPPYLTDLGFTEQEWLAKFNK